MGQSVTIEKNLLGEFKNFKMPLALKNRLNDLLDKQDLSGTLSEKERKEAEALVDLAELLTLLKVKSLSSSRKAKE